jgi:hypothetical protein
LLPIQPHAPLKPIAPPAHRAALHAGRHTLRNGWWLNYPHCEWVIAIVVIIANNASSFSGLPFGDLPWTVKTRFPQDIREFSTLPARHPTSVRQHE